MFIFIFSKYAGISPDCISRMVSITFLHLNGTIFLPPLQILPFAAKYIRRHNFLSTPFSLSYALGCQSINIIDTNPSAP